MPRRSLQTLAGAARKSLVADTSTLPKYVLRDTGVFARAIGISAEKFLAYKPSTRLKYIRAAEQGRTAAQERERVRVQRNTKRGSSATKKAATGVQSDPRWREVKHLQQEMRAEGLDARSGALVGMDRLAFHDLYSDESLEQHVIVYGFDYVLERMRAQYAALRQYNTSGGVDREMGRDRWYNQFGTLARRDFAASAAVEDDDERWYWYHAGHGGELHYG